MLPVLFDLPKNPHSIGSFKVERWATPAEGMVLYTLIQAHQICSYLECGTANGYSAMWAMVAGVKNVITWDIHERKKIWNEMPELYEWTQKWGNDDQHCRCITGSFSEGVGTVQAPGPRLFFIDGHHTRRAVRRDWSAVRPLMEPGDVVVFHDAREECVLGLCEHLSSVRGYRGGIVRTERDMGVYFA